MNKPHIIFVHGWGMSTDFWTPLATALPYENTILNLGYKGEESISSPKQKSIYITHSLGTMWALKNQAEHISTLISINGFHNFQSFTDTRTLQAMKLRLDKNPMAQMQDFFTVAGLLATPERLNIEALQNGLGLLTTGNETETLKSLSCPVLALASTNDSIVPIEVSQKQWFGYDLKICEKGGHALPVTHTDWCAEQIEKLLSKG